MNDGGSESVEEIRTDPDPGQLAPETVADEAIRQHLSLQLQFIAHPAATGRLVVIPEDQFLMLERAAAIGIASLGVGQRKAYPLPDHVKKSIADGENPIRVIRRWRGLKAYQLAALTGITSSMVSQIERDGKTGSTKTFKTVADVLGVPMDVIYPPHPDGV
jgi:DNA-binding XRE family transcriptional regulator